MRLRGDDARSNRLAPGDAAAVNVGAAFWVGAAKPHVGLVGAVLMVAPLSRPVSGTVVIAATAAVVIVGATTNVGATTGVGAAGEISAAMAASSVASPSCPTDRDAASNDMTSGPVLTRLLRRGPAAAVVEVGVVVVVEIGAAATVVEIGAWIGAAVTVVETGAASAVVVVKATAIKFVTVIGSVVSSGGLGTRDAEISTAAVVVVVVGAGVAEISSTATVMAAAGKDLRRTTFRTVGSGGMLAVSSMEFLVLETSAHVDTSAAADGGGHSAVRADSDGGSIHAFEERGATGGIRSAGVLTENIEEAEVMVGKHMPTDLRRTVGARPRPDVVATAVVVVIGATVGEISSTLFSFAAIAPPAAVRLRDFGCAVALTMSTVAGAGSTCIVASCMSVT